MPGSPPDHGRAAPAPRTTGLDAVFSPRSVLLAGASRNPARIGGKILHRLRTGGYEGRLEVLSAHADVQGVPARETLDGMEPVDVAVVTLPARATLDAVEGLAAAQAARAAIVCSSGFADAGDTGAQQRLLTTCEEAGIALVGPNALGVFSAPSRFVGMFGTQLDRPGALPLPDGDVAIASESGAVAAFIHAGLQDAHVGVRHWAALGNAAMTSVADLLRFYAGDPDVDNVLVYQEAVTAVEDLLDGLRACADAGRRVFFLTSGASDAGRRAAAFHTGRSAGDHRLVRALARGAGAILADSIEHMVDLAKARRLGRRGGGGWVVGTISGGAGVEAADEAAVAGLPLAAIPPALRGRLTQRLPAFASLENPVDVTAQVVNDPGLVAAATGAVLAEPGVAGMLWVLGLQEATGRDIARELAAVAGPDAEVAVAWLSAPAAAVETLQAHGVPVYDSIVRMVAAVAGVAGCGDTPPRAVAEVAGGDTPPRAAAVPEPVVKGWLADAGLRVPAAEPELGDGRTAVVKVAAPFALHKRTDGLMVGPVATDAEREAARAVLERRSRELGLEGATVFAEAWQPPAAREWFVSIVGGDRGPTVLVGSGGAAVERATDVRAALPADAATLVDDFADPPTALQALNALLAVFERHDLELLEINPLAEDAGGALRCLDAVACRRGDR